MSKLYIGVMSGTSLDGADVVLCEINTKKCKLIKSLHYPYSKKLKTEILNTINKKTTLKQIGTLNIKLGKLFAKAINKLIDRYKIDISNIEAIGLHGQTLWHNPDKKYPFSMQLGDPNTLSSKTGIKVVNDFRSMDMANGGEGAPFTPVFHQFLFNDNKKTAVLNIGGISNITILGKELKGWDCGSGNILIDLWINRSKKLPFDKNGKFAKSGKLNTKLLQNMLDDSYFLKKPPKSTGREKFNKKYLLDHLSKFKNLKDEDVQRTLLEFSIKPIIDDIKTHKIKKLIVCGGGVNNKFLMKRLKKFSKIKVLKSDKLGVSSEYLEAMAFAWFAYKRLKNETINLNCVTGAKKNSLLGGIYG